MDIIEIVGLLASAIAIIIAIIQFAKWLFRGKVSNRPLIDVQLEYVKGSSAPMGIGPNAIPAPGRDYFENATSLHLFQLKKNIKLTLLNNSDVTAYYPKYALHDLSSKITFEKLNSLTPIVPHASVTILGEYSEYEEVLPKNRTKIENFPSEQQRQQIKLLIEYQSVSRKKYYSEFSGDLNTTVYLNGIPSKYRLESNGQTK